MINSRFTWQQLLCYLPLCRHIMESPVNINQIALCIKTCVVASKYYRNNFISKKKEYNHLNYIFFKIAPLSKYTYLAATV
jgi:hypothetical protein